MRNYLFFRNPFQIKRKTKEKLKTKSDISNTGAEDFNCHGQRNRIWKGGKTRINQNVYHKYAKLKQKIEIDASLFDELGKWWIFKMEYRKEIRKNGKRNGIREN